MKYRHKTTGEVVEVEVVIGFAVTSAHDVRFSTFKNFHKTYEPLEEGGTDA
jgi:hypothetical protein